MKAKILKNTLTVMTILLILSMIGFALTGKKIGWGPFSFLHSWQADVDDIKETYSKERKGEIIFYGASNFALWETIEEDMIAYKVQNHAFGGSKDIDLVEYADQILYPYQPHIVVFQTGSNDYTTMSGTDEEKVKKCIKYKKEMFLEFHKKLPNTKFIIMSGLLLPGRSEYVEMTLMINNELKAYADTEEYIYFVDANTLTYDGIKLNKTLFRKDMIHLNHEGQLLWYKDYILPALEQVITENELNQLRN